jgi:SHS family sialic acid transporter-like MFS transporter
MIAVPETRGATSVDLPWYRAITWLHWRVLIAAWAVWSLDAIDFLGLTFVLTDISKTFGVSLSTTSLLLLITYAVRWIGGLLFGSLSDRIGRKVPLLICLVWFTLFAVTTGLATSFTWIVISRLLLGFGMAPGFSLGATLVAETWPAKYRALGIGIHDSGWAVGGLGASLAYGLIYPWTGWRGVFFVGVIPAIIVAVFIVFCVPESPIWRRPEKPQSIFGEPAAMLFRRHLRVVAYLALLMLCLFFSNWPLLGLFPTYLRSLQFPTSTIATLTFTVAAGQLVGFVCAGLVAEALGRRRGLASVMISGVVAILLMIFVIHNLFLAEALGFIGGALLIGASGGMWGTVLSEHLPTEVRASGIGFLYNLGSLAGGFAPFFVLSIVNTLGLDFGVALGGTTVIAVVLVLTALYFARETKGVSLTDIK